MRNPCLWKGFDQPLQGKNGEDLAAVLRDYETFQLDLATGGLNREKPGGYRYVEQVFGRKPSAVGANDSPPPVKAISNRVYAELGARVGVFYHESGTRPEAPFEFRNGLLARPSDFSVTRFKMPGNPEGGFWWDLQDSPRAEQSDPVALLKRQLAD